MITRDDNSGVGQPGLDVRTSARPRSSCARNGDPAVPQTPARFAENAYFIKHPRARLFRKTVEEIAREMFSYADGCTMSAKRGRLGQYGGLFSR